VATEAKQDIIDAIVDAIKVQSDKMTFTGANIQSDLKSINGFTNSDGVSFQATFELINAMVNGRFLRDTPAPGQTTFYKRDNTTVLTILSISETERTRVA
jgi:hypothetical protein